jgi:hypothetical protein
MAQRMQVPPLFFSTELIFGGKTATCAGSRPTLRSRSALSGSFSVNLAAYNGWLSANGVDEITASTRLTAPGRDAPDSSPDSGNTREVSVRVAC